MDNRALLRTLFVVLGAVGFVVAALRLHCSARFGAAVRLSCGMAVNAVCEWHKSVCLFTFLLNVRGYFVSALRRIAASARRLRCDHGTKPGTTCWALFSSAFSLALL